MNVSLRQLIYLRETARARSFTEAAERLHTSQSNLSTAIRDLEVSIGTRLIDRTTKRFELTEIGLDFLFTVERVLDDLQGAVDNVSAAGRLERGVLAIGAPPLLAATLLADSLGVFHDSHPGLDILFQDAATSELTKLLRSRDIELALGTFQETDKDIISKPLFADRLVVLAHPGLAVPSPCPWRALLELPVVSIARSSSVGQLIQRTIWRTTQTNYRPVVEANNWTTVVSLTQTLRAMCVVPQYAAGRVTSVMGGRELTQIELHRPKVERTISVAYLRSRALSPTGRAFLALLARTWGPG